jgi:hypothetical protein
MKISYEELAKRVGDCVLNNEIHKQHYDDFELYNGKDDYCYKHNNEAECEEKNEGCDYEYKDIYQEYIITQSGAEYLKRNTNEIVYYSGKLDMYLWCITHFGTNWSGVFTNLITK